MIPSRQAWVCRTHLHVDYGYVQGREHEERTRCRAARRLFVLEHEPTWAAPTSASAENLDPPVGEALVSVPAR